MAANDSTIALPKDRFRMVVNVVDAVPKEAPLPKLPVARALWVPQPDFRTATTAWILAGGAPHTLTIMANALRVAAAIIARGRAGGV